MDAFPGSSGSESNGARSMSDGQECQQCRRSFRRCECGRELDTESKVRPMAGTFREYWDRIVTANGDMADEACVIKIGVNGFREQLRKAYQQGAMDQKQLSDEMRQSDPVSRLGDMFGFK